MSKYRASFQAGFLVLTAISLVFALPSSSLIQIPAKPQFGGTLHVKSFGNVFKPNFDPAGDSHIFVLEQLYDGLVKLDSDLNPTPSLAEYWEISPDGKKYVFHLRKGVMFHHGEELTADDVKFSLERLVSREIDSPFHQYFTAKVVGAQEFWEGKADDIQGFTVRDRYIFEIHWKNPYVSGLYLMSMYFCKILPKDQVLSQGRRFFQKPSGTGPFKFAYWVRGPQLDILGVRLERNQDYFDKVPYLEALEFSPHYTLDHFVDREIEVIPYISERLSSTDCQVLTDGFFDLVYLGISCHIPPLNKVAIRKALLSGINKRKIAEEAYSIERTPEVLDNYIPPKLPGFFPNDGSENYDVVNAQAILREEGYTGKVEFPTLNFIVVGRRDQYSSRIFRALRDEFEVLGVRLRLRTLDTLEDLEEFKEPYIVFMDWRMDFPDPENIIRNLFFSQSVFNCCHYSNPILDKLLEAAEVERSRTKRIELFHRIEQVLYKDIPAIPLFSNHQRIALQSYIRGAKMAPLGFYFMDLKGIWLER